ncbi:MAG: hypothetical protein AAGA18_07885 [Verrucomicrobiota bacterium]
MYNKLKLYFCFLIVWPYLIGCPSYAFNQDLLGIDTIFLHEPSDIPNYKKSREIQCVIIEENANTVKIETSQFRGISDVREIPRSNIRDIKRGDRSKILFKEIKDLLLIPSTSKSLAFYDHYKEKHFQNFLENYPKSAGADEIRKFLNKFDKEKELVAQKWTRIDDKWYPPNKHAQVNEFFMINDLMMEVMRAQEKLGNTIEHDIDILADEMQQLGNSIYYPYLVEGLRYAFPQDVVNTSDHPKLQKILRTDESKLLTAINQFAETYQTYHKFKESDLKNPNILKEIFINLKRVSQTWSGLTPLVDFFKSEIVSIKQYYWDHIFSSIIDLNKNIELVGIGELGSLSESIQLDTITKHQIEQNLAEIKQFSQNVSVLISKNQLNENVRLRLPESAPETAKEQWAEIKANIRQKASNRKVNEARGLITAGDYFRAGKTLITARELWPENTELNSVKTMMLDIYKNKLVYYQIDEAHDIITEMKTVWPDDPNLPIEEIAYHEAKTHLNRIITGVVLILVGGGIIAICLVTWFRIAPSMSNR